MSRKKGKKRAGATSGSRARDDVAGRSLHELADNLLFAGILLILFFRPFVSGRTYPHYNHFFHIGVAVLAALWILKSRKDGTLEIHNRLLTGFVLAFALVCSATFFTSVNKGLTLRYIFEIISYSLLFLLIANNFREKNSIKVAIGIVFVSAFIISVYGIWQYYHTLEMTRRYLEMVMKSGDEEFLMGIPLNTGILHRLETKRAFATFLYPNAYAMFLVLIGSLAAGWAWEMRQSMLSFTISGIRGVFRRDLAEPAPRTVGEKTSKSHPALRFLSVVGAGLWNAGKAFTAPLFVVFCILLLWNLYLTYSRGGWLSALAAVMIFVGVRIVTGRQASQNGNAVATAVMLIASLFLCMKTIPADASMVQEPSLISRIRDSQTIEHRLSYWSTAVTMISDNPWFGVGWGAFEKAYPKYMVLGGYPVKLAHNNFLQVWAETGIIGLNAFAGMWLVFLYTFWKKAVSGPAVAMRGVACGLGTAVIAFLVNSVVDFALYLPALAYLVFAFMGLLVAIPAPQEQSDKFTMRVPGVAAIFLLLILSFYSATLFKSYISLQYRNRAEALRNAAFPTEFARHVGFESDPEKQRSALRAGISLLERSINLYPLDAEAHHLLGDNYLRMSQMEEQPGYLHSAIEHLKRASNLDPFSPYVYQSLATAYWTAGNAWDRKDMFEKSLEAERRASENFPVNPEFHDRLRQIYDALGRTDEAKREATLAEKLRKYYKEF